jgi:hypothetical protein
MIFAIDIDNGKPTSTLVEDADGVELDLFDDLKITLTKEFIKYYAKAFGYSE